MALTWNEECRQAARFSDAQSKAPSARRSPQSRRRPSVFTDNGVVRTGGRRRRPTLQLGRSWESKHGWGWYPGWDKKVTKGGRNAARFQITVA